MTDGDDSKDRVQPDYDELQAKRYGRQVRDWIQYRDAVLAGDPESTVSLETAAAILSLQVSDIKPATGNGELGFIEVGSERVVRLGDLQAAYAEDRRRRKEFADGWMRLRADWDD